MTMLSFHMKTILISDFKAQCIAIINEVHQTKDTIVITRRGKPVAKLEPFVFEEPERKLGNLKKMRIEGDIVHTDFSEEWEINR
jgi:prevent-host-death family protein